MKFIILILIFINFSQAIIKDKNINDVFSLAENLKKKIIHLGGESDINPRYMEIDNQNNKSPRHVMQKTLEVLTKINKYRELNGLGSLNIPQYPSRKITSEDLYFNILRLNDEINLLLIKLNCSHINELNNDINIYIGKTFNDTYREVWLASLAMDEILGKGFSPKDNYKQSMLIIDIIKFLRNSQSIYSKTDKPIKKFRKHPNHVLYATNRLLQKIAVVEKRLWMEPIEVPKNPQRIITPTEVYDSLQTVITELKMIRKRLGIERFYETPNIKESKTPSDVLQNIEYAINIFPKFNLKNRLIQYPNHSLIKTTNELYALSVYILDKIEYLKKYKGIKVESNKVPKIYGLNEMYVYQKSIEIMGKINKLRIKDGLYPISLPKSPNKIKTTNNLYDALLMIDDEVTIIMEQNNIKDIKRWNYLIDKDTYIDKTNSDIYHNLWKIATIIDIYRGDEYTINETCILAEELNQRISIIIKTLLNKVSNFERLDSNKRLSDVFDLSLVLFEELKKVLIRANIPQNNILIPKEKNITLDTIYNALRIINTTLIDISVHFEIDFKINKIILEKNKTVSDLFNELTISYKKIQLLLNDENYED